MTLTPIMNLTPIPQAAYAPPQPQPFPPMRAAPQVGQQSGGYSYLSPPILVSILFVSCGQFISILTPGGDDGRGKLQPRGLG